MQRINVSCAGKLKEQFWIAACNEYSKRLSAYCTLSISECHDTKQPAADVGAFTVALCSEGEMLSSQQLANLMQKWQNNGVSKICFLIGGSDGLSDSTKEQADFKLSLSRMTWPHHMVRAMLLEQLYRGYSILNGGKYHK